MIDVAALYKFTPFADPAALRPGLIVAGAAHGVRGTLLLAPEGINGTIAATELEPMLTAIRALPGCADLEVKRASAARMPFGKLKVRLKREIVTMGVPDVDPRAGVGAYVEPQDWNALIARDDVAVIDVRNDYEVAIGSFAGAEDPGTQRFGDFPAWWAANAHRFAGKTVAMFCTGGIRCEKATAYLKAEGVADVRHLKGGILAYLETVPEAQSQWRGDCFVFDGRVSVGHGLQQGAHTLCHACRRPVAPADRAHPDYEEGVQCPACVADYDAADRARFRERMRQIRLARQRGRDHLGAA